MNPACLLNRLVQLKKTFFTANSTLIRKTYYSTSGSSNDENKNQTEIGERKKKSEDVLNKLNHLLKSMIDEDSTGSNKPKLELAKPVKRKNEKVKEDSVKIESPEKKLTEAVKNVAQVIGGDTKQTESELLMKLLSTSENKTANDLNDLVKGMKIEREETSQEAQTRAQQVKQILQHVQETKLEQGRPRPRARRVRSEIPAEKIDLFASEPLGIFTDLTKDADEGVQNETWNKLYKRDLKLAVTHPPSNYFQQIILWTEQGKVWKFPIDNEQGLEEEKEVYFTEHVFLEQHLEPWCPQKGPLRHFMELVCVGLSKNPYLTVEAKKEHIDWFKKYFEEKKQLLKEVGALPGNEFNKGSSQKQIE